MIKDWFILALKNIRKRKLRSWLTIFGIFISITTIFLLISLSLGLEDAVEEQFEILGTDKFFIQPRGQLGPPGSTSVSVELSMNDVDAIKKVSGIKEVSWFIIGNAEIESNDETRYTLSIGIDIENFELGFGDFDLDDGRIIKEDSKEVMLGYQYKYRNYFEKPINIGDSVLINKEEFRVKGIVEEVGNPQDDRQIYLTENDFRELFGIENRVDVIIAQIDEGEDMQEISERVEKRMRSVRGVTKKTQDFTILTPEELLESFGNILSVITSFLLGVSAISLLVGGIGIANTMYTSVLERTREIGVMKAIGAQRRDILGIFVVESGLIGLIGGIIGVILGIVGAKMIEAIGEQSGISLLSISIPSSLVIGCLLFSFIIGSVSGFLPALRAVKINTVEALRYE